MVHSPKLSLVALAAAAALSSDPVGVAGFVHPGGTRVSSTRSRSSPLHMSVSMPGDGSSSWDQSSSDNGNPNMNPGDVESSSDTRYTTDQYDGYDGAFPLPDDMEIPETRQLRWEREALLQSKFASGDDLFDLRRNVASLRNELVDLRASMDDAFSSFAKGRIAELEQEILALNGRDAEFMYAVSLELLEKAQEDGDEELIQKYSVQAEEARLCIPELNMHGLWVGKYGEHGYEMINVTYSGDILVATKVTGDNNVPKGEVSFTVDLAPKIVSNSMGESMMALEPIELNPKASKQWGKKYLPRHVGKGQVASEGFTNNQWLEGQLILVGRFFSFAWVPVGAQVFFGRPSSELTIKMLKEAEEAELRKDHVAVMRDTVKSMWEETHWAERDAHHNFIDEGCFE